MRKYLLYILLLFSLSSFAQIGEHRNTLSVGVNGGYALTRVGFTPKVTQASHGGLVGGLSFRYISEKYFKTFCSIYGEVTFSQGGWNENIVDVEENKVVKQSYMLPHYI